MQETRVRSLGWEDALEQGMATHSSILAWRIPTDGGSWRATAHGVTESRTRLNDQHFQFFQTHFKLLYKVYFVTEQYCSP